MVTVDGVKMGKSLGNFTTIKKALETHSPLAIRFFILSSHYRSTLDFSQDALDAAEKGMQRIHSFVQKVHTTTASGEKDPDFEKEITLYASIFMQANTITASSCRIW